MRIGVCGGLPCVPPPCSPVPVTAQRLSIPSASWCPGPTGPCGQQDLRPPAPWSGPAGRLRGLTLRTSPCSREEAVPRPLPGADSGVCAQPQCPSPGFCAQRLPSSGRGRNHRPGPSCKVQGRTQRKVGPVEVPLTAGLPDGAGGAQGGGVLTGQDSSAWRSDSRKLAAWYKTAQSPGPPAPGQTRVLPGQLGCPSVSS